MPPATPLTPAERFAQIVAMMVGMIGARLERPGKPGLAGPLTFAIYLRLTGMRNRLTRYVARWHAGTLTPPRPRIRRAAPRPPRSKPGQWDHLPKLPRGRMWLTRLVPGIIVGANHLEILLEDPEMAAMLRAAPQIGRTLRPFWHMLSPDPLPDILQRPRSAPSAAPLTAPVAVAVAAAAADPAAPPAPPRPRPPRMASRSEPLPRACGPPPVPA